MYYKYEVHFVVQLVFKISLSTVMEIGLNVTTPHLEETLAEWFHSVTFLCQGNEDDKTCLGPTFRELTPTCTRMDAVNGNTISDFRSQQYSSITICMYVMGKMKTKMKIRTPHKILITIA